MKRIERNGNCPELIDVGADRARLPNGSPVDPRRVRRNIYRMKRAGLWRGNSTGVVAWLKSPRAQAVQP